MKITLRFALQFLVAGVFVQTVEANSSKVDGNVAFQKNLQPLLSSYCFKCHGPEKQKAGINLAAFTDLPSIYREMKTWETVLRQVRDREMPPKDKPQPSEEERSRLIEGLTAMLSNPDPAALPKDPGRKLIHRLNHAEYRNTVRDLLGVEAGFSAKFPSDGSGGGGFDNNASTLFIPPLLMEKYLEAANEIVEKAESKRIFIFEPGRLTSRKSAAEKIARHFATRGYRRPAEREEVNSLLAIYDQLIKGGDSHEGAVKGMLKAILVSPAFLFRIEADQNSSAPYRISDYELANRTSYFLWSSMPDEELFRLAARNRLHEPRVLDQQVRRMIRDPKGRAFSENFVGQWLRVRELYTSAQPEPDRFSGYTPQLRDAMYREPIELFHAIVTEDTSLLQLLDANHTFVNHELAAHYGIKGVEGDAMQRVKLSDRNRGGVLTMAGPLTLTSYPRRTSPVLRGKWILEEILGTPPPPPPPLVAALPPDDQPKEGLTLRQRLEKHRQDPNCASCHKRMDPLGFGLENFDLVGRWRTNIAEFPVDATGEMVTGEKFNGPAELKQLLIERKPQFVRNLTEKMLAYALGRGVEYYDRPTVKQITDALEQDNYRAMTLITGIVKSYPFQYRRNEPIALSKN